MNQILKISIARGGCRFATPLYLGASYVLSFDGARSDEAKTVLFTKPNSRTPEKTEGIEGLAITVEEGSDIVLKLNRQSLVDWFMSCGECDVDGYVDAHCYVFNSDGDVIADDGVHIEYRPVDFVVDATGFTQYSALAERVGTLEAFRVEDRAKIDANESAIAELQDEDQSIRDDMAAAISEQAGQTLESAKNYADLLRQMVAKMMYIRDVDESESAGYDRYRRVEAKKNSLNQVIISLSDELFNLEGGDSSTNRYLYTDTNNVEDYDEHGDPTTDHNPITGNKTFTGVVLVNTPLAADNSKKPATTAWVRTFDATQWDAHKATLLATANTWSAKQTFSGGVEGNVTGNVTGNLTGNVTGNVTGNLTGGATVGSGKSLSVDGISSFSGTETHTGAETHVGAEAHTGSEIHTGAVTLGNVVAREVSTDDKHADSTRGINEAFAWKMIMAFAKYFDGSWRIITGKNLSSLNPTHAENQTATWRIHDRQYYLVLPEETDICDYFNYSADNVYAFHAPNAKTLGELALGNNQELQSLYMPKLESVGIKAFSGCTALLPDAINATLSSVKSLGKLAFFHTMNQNNSGVDKRIVLPNLVRGDAGCFHGLSAYQAVNGFEIGKDVSLDGFKTADDLEANWEDLFAYCGGLGENTIRNVRVEGGASDEGQKALTLVLDKLAELYAAANDGRDLREDFTSFCPNLIHYHTSYTYDFVDRIEAPNTQLIGDGCVVYCQYTRFFDLSNALFIGSYAFAMNCYNTSAYVGYQRMLSIPKCRFISPYAFGSENTSYYCFHLRSMRADELEYIAPRAFNFTQNFYGIYAPNVKKIGGYAFNHCLHLCGSFYTKYLPDSATFDASKLTAEDYAGDNVNGIVVEGGDTTLLNRLCFNNCTHVGEYAFESCTNIKTLELNSAVSIGTGAFKNMISGTASGADGIHHLYIRGYDFTGMSDSDLNTLLGTTWQLPAAYTVHATYVDGGGATRQRDITYRNSAWQWVND